MSLKKITQFSCRARTKLKLHVHCREPSTITSTTLTLLESQGYVYLLSKIELHINPPCSKKAKAGISTRLAKKTPREALIENQTQSKSIPALKTPRRSSNGNQISPLLKQKPSQGEPSSRTNTQSQSPVLNKEAKATGRPARPPSRKSDSDRSINTQKKKKTAIISSAPREREQGTKWNFVRVGSGCG